MTTPPDLSSKSAVRTYAKQIRTELDMSAVSQAICDQLAGQPEFFQAQTILTYHPMPGEVDLMSLLDFRPQKQWYLPRVDDAGGMQFYRYQPGDLLEKHPLGMQEPSVNCEQFDLTTLAHTLAVILVPGLAFDKQGHRVGYGKGYYDRFFQNLPPKNKLFKIGVIPQPLLLQQLPHEEWDIRVNCTITNTNK